MTVTGTNTLKKKKKNNNNKNERGRDSITSAEEEAFFFFFLIQRECLKNFLKCHSLQKSIFITIGESLPVQMPITRRHRIKRSMRVCKTEGGGGGGAESA